VSTSLLDHPDNLFNRLSGLTTESVGLPTEVIHKKTAKRGRPVGKSVPLTEQIMIGLAARVDGTTAAARAHGVTVSTADGYKDGSTQQGLRDAKPHPVLKPALDATIKKVGDMVADRILGSIAAIEVTNGKVRGLDPDKPQASASLAHTLASVHEKLNGSGKSNDNRVQILIYGPEERSEDKYDSIEVPATLEETR
jgi:hypothetical protein